MGRRLTLHAKGPEARCSPRAPGRGEENLGTVCGAQNRTSRRGLIACSEAINYLSIPFENGRNLPCQSPIYDRSEGAAGAVRDHSSQPRPEGANSTGAAAPWSIDLTPARWRAKRVAASLCAASGSGGAVPARTATEPPQNRQPLEIISDCLRFSRFYAGASRNACAPTCVHPCVYARGSIHRTIEPLANVYRLEGVSGSVAVLCRFWSEPMASASAKRRGSAPLPNKLAGGYRGALGGLVPIEACRAILLSGVAQSFGVLVGARPSGARGLVAGRVDRAADQGEGLEVGPRGGNGGNLPLLGCLAGRVGRVMLEGSALRPGLEPLRATWPLPVRLMRGQQAGGGRAACRAPPSPPSRPARSTSPLALAAGRVSIGLPARAQARCRMSGTERVGAKVGGPGMGRGVPRRAKAAMQRRVGVQALGLEGREPRENGHDIGGQRHVNH